MILNDTRIVCYYYNSSTEQQDDIFVYKISSTGREVPYGERIVIRLAKTAYAGANPALSLEVIPSPKYNTS